MINENVEADLSEGKIGKTEEELRKIFSQFESDETGIIIIDDYVYGDHGEKVLLLKIGNKFIAHGNGFTVRIGEGNDKEDARNVFFSAVNEMYENDGYYDLVEFLGSGRHIPVPIARKIIGAVALGEIPVSKKVRDNNFFSCPECGTTDFYASIKYCCVEDEEEIERREEAEEGERELKEKALAMIVRKGQFYKLRYIRAVNH